MTFWQFLIKAFTWLADRTTRILATTLGTISTFVGTGIIPEHHMKYYGAAIAVLTFWRAQAITHTVTEAKKVIASQKHYAKGGHKK
jgi:hypothetical protein